MTTTNRTTPALQTSLWLNSPQLVTLECLRGRAVVLHAFQMLCPGCVSHGLPQALRIHRLFPQEQVALISLHTVFKHHDVMGPEALRVFLHGYRIPFPVGVDQADPGGPVPVTMQGHGMRGTPGVVVFDRDGRVRLNHSGQIDDLHLRAIERGQADPASPEPCRLPLEGGRSRNGLKDGATARSKCNAAASGALHPLIARCDSRFAARLLSGTRSSRAAGRVLPPRGPPAPAPACSRPR